MNNFQTILNESQEQFTQLFEAEKNDDFEITSIGITELHMLDKFNIFQVTYDIELNNDGFVYYLTLDKSNSSKNTISKVDNWKIKVSEANKYPEALFIRKNITNIVLMCNKEFMKHFNKMII